jgi:hypothetical protein
MLRRCVTLGRVDPDGLYRQLALNKQLLDAAVARFAGLSDGLDHPRITTARNRLEVCGVALTRAAGGVSAWTRTWLGAVLLGLAAWAVAAVAGQLIGVSGGWTVTLTAVAVLALLWPVNALNNVLADRVNRRRTGPPVAPLAIEAPTGLDPAEEVVGILWGARDGLAIVMRRWSAAPRFGYVARTAAGFDWLRQRDPRLFWLSLADRCLCQAIYSIEIWLDDPERDR